MRLLYLALASVLTVPGAEMEILTPELPWAIVGRGYRPPPLETRISGRCPAGTVGYSVVAGMLPPGVQLSAAGYLSGSPVRMGRYPVVIRAANACFWTAKRFELVVAGAPLVLAEPARLEFRIRAGDQAPPQNLRVSATWPGVPYQTATEAPWLQAAPERGRVPAAGSGLESDVVRVEIAAADLAPGRYDSVLRVFVPDAANAPAVAVLLVVEPAVKAAPTMPGPPPPE